MKYEIFLQIFILKTILKTYINFELFLFKFDFKIDIKQIYKHSNYFILLNMNLNLKSNLIILDFNL